MAGKKKGKKGKKARARVHKPSEFSEFAPTDPNQINKEVHEIRAAITRLRKSLFLGSGVKPNDYRTIIRIEPSAHPLPHGIKSADCGCGCS
jgi:hypothetical protein